MSTKLLDGATLECDHTVRSALQHMMATVHVQIIAACQVGLTMRQPAVRPASKPTETAACRLLVGGQGHASWTPPNPTSQEYKHD